jgi:glycolate oxidase subunit GlcD
MNTELVGQLRRLVGAEHVRTSRFDAEVYSYDASLAVAAPDAIVLPADTDQTAAVVRTAVAAGAPCVPRGFGTNLSGGSIAPRGGVVIGLSRLNRILDMRPEGRYAVVQAGTTNLELQNALAPLGFYYAPDPASQKVSTLGGNIGENSGGPHCLKYGVTTNHVLGMTIVMPDGEVVQLGGPALDPPGYDLRGLLVGSEGTLGIATEVVVRILPRPAAVLTLLVVYDDVSDAAQSVSDIIAAGIVPATLEMMDATVIRAIEDSKPCGYPRTAAAVLIAEVDGPAAGLAAQAERISELCTKNRCREVRRARDDAERDRLWSGRRGAFGAIARAAPSFLVADCTVPRTHLPEALRRVGAIAAQHGLSHGNVFHAGDGNLHPLLLFDSRNAEQRRRVHEAGHAIMEACVALGGTISGEHGIGVEKADAMRLVFSDDDLDFQRRIRAALDPRDLLNPGKILPTTVAAGSAPAATGDGEPPAAPLGGPEPEWVPADAAEACEQVRRAGRDRLALTPRGNGTQADFGNCPTRPTIPLRSTGLTAVSEYDRANQVISVGAGLSLESLQDLLSPNSQWLPVRPPRAASRTVGGIAALGACGPERLRYGAPRDLLLGLKFISGSGRLIAAGGRVVKNVTGYDVTRLLAGSAGTLGFLTELTFRVLSLPACCAAVVGSGPLAACGAAATALLQSKLEPNFVVAVPSNVALQVSPGAEWRLMVGFEGFPETVAWQAAQGQTLIAQVGLAAPERRAYAPREGACQEFFDTLDRAPFLLRLDLPLNSVTAFLSHPPQPLDGAAVLADFGCGRVVLATPEMTGARWLAQAQRVEQLAGRAVLEKAPLAFRREHDVFGRPRPDWPLMHRLKVALDPHHVFSPGAMPGRL